MKVAPLWRAFSHAADFAPTWVHTGQHYDPTMSEGIWRELGLPDPAFHLDVRAQSHAEQTARIMLAYEPIALAERPDWLIVVGDVNSTLAGALVGSKLGIPTVHLEAGLRSGSRDTPEEINRLAVDVLCDVLWTPSPDADANLASENVEQSRYTRVGNVMIDSLVANLPEIDANSALQDLGLENAAYSVVTFHRPSNVDDPNQLARLVDALVEVQERLPLVFPVHPRTAKRLAAGKLDAKLRAAGVRLLAPQTYRRFIKLVSNAALVVTDSGGLQEETTYLGVPCLTLRTNTDRPVTILQGTNRLVTAAALGAAVTETLGRPRGRMAPIEFWDGETASRCVEDLRRRSMAFEQRKARQH
jgi:UDP-N-acetylglucosamine 2-epimerase (non-hydrolysing)